MLCGRQFGLAGQADHPHPVLDRHLHLGAETRQHPLGMVPRRFRLAHHGLARRVQPGQQHRRLHLGRGHGQCVVHRDRILRPHQRQRQPPALASVGPRAEQRHRIGDPPHRPRPQRGIAGEGGTEGRGRHRPHDQPHAGARIAAVDHVLGLGEAAHAHALHRPVAAAVIGDLRSEGAHRLRGVQHVLAFQQPRDPGLAHGQRPQDQRPVADRLVAGHMGLAPERPRRVGGHRDRIAVGRHLGRAPRLSLARCRLPNCRQGVQHPHASPSQRRGFTWAIWWNRSSPSALRRRIDTAFSGSATCRVM